MKHWFGWVAVAGLALGVGACGKGATPTAEVALATATRISSPAPTTTLSSTPLPQTPSATPRPKTSSTLAPWLTPPPKPTSSPSTPVWSADVIEIKANDLGATWRVEWLNASEVQLEKYFFGKPVVVDSSSGLVLTPTPYATLPPNDWNNYDELSASPNGAYAMECTPGNLRLIRTSDNQTVGQLPIEVFHCWGIDWSYDSAKVAFAGDDGAVYIWPMSESTPSRRDYGLFMWGARWSPDAQRLALVTSAKSLSADNASVYIVEAGATALPSQEFEVTGGNQWYPEFVNWVTNDVILNIRAGLEWRQYEYFDAQTGKELTSGYVSTYWGQVQSGSPDERWLVLDQSNSQASYQLFDLYSRTVTALSEVLSTQLDFVGWSDESSAFYAISRPADESATASYKVPFGLLALDPITAQFAQLFDHAVFARLNPDKTLVWIVFPARQENGTLGLAGGIFNLSAKTLTGREFVSDHLLYASPADGDLVPVAWSNDGTRVVFGDASGTLMLMALDGSTRVLATGLPAEAWPTQVHYAWSPDDARLLVQHGNRAWVVALP